MAREKKNIEEDIALDMDEIQSESRVQIPINSVEQKSTAKSVLESKDNLVNCLRNEKVIVRFIKKARGMITDPRHVLFGGMAERAKLCIPTPVTGTGQFMSVLTKDEEKYLEYILGFEPGHLNVHKRDNNFWSDANEDGIGRIELIKGDNPLDLSDPMDYIRYKILLKCSNIVAPSIQALQDRPKATYKFVLVSDEDAAKASNTRVSLKAQAYTLFGKISDDVYKMRVIIELLDGRPTAANSKAEFLQGKLGELIEANTKMFLQVAKDPLLDNKILIKKAIEAGIIVNRGNYLYIKDGNLPLCENGQEPTLSVAAKYLSLPKQQELKFSLEAKLN